MHRAVFTTIIQADPIYVDFAVPADEHRMLEILRSAGYMKTAKEGITVKVALGDGTVYDKTGKIDFQDQTVDPATADIKSRAVFETRGTSSTRDSSSAFMLTETISTM